MARPPPGPKGASLGKLNYELWRADMLGFLAALAEHYGDVVGFALGRSRCILVNGAAEVRALFLEHEACLRKPEFVKSSNRGHWGDGLTTLEGPAWEARRRLIQSCFGARSMARALPLVAECAAGMLDTWSSLGEADLLKEFRMLTARIAARLVLDAELEGYGCDNGRSGVLPVVEVYGDEHIGSSGGDPTAPLVMVRPRAPARMDIAVRMIDERIKTGEARQDILSDLVRARFSDGERLTRDEIVDEVIQMLYAGHHTIPSTLVNFWRDISATDAVRIAAESDYLSARGVWNWPDLSVSYCLAALKESMRLHPPAPIIYREVESAFELCGFEFPRNVAVWVSPQLLHNDARYFPEPNLFRPDRFMKDTLAVTPRSPYFPFGAGRRVCVASHMALQQMTLIALLTARRFRLISARDGCSVFRLQAVSQSRSVC
ncbi:MAG TPA: cytochrome P450 [Xanthobacteraceae bacterium]|jgi:cytochrome P450